MLKTVNKQLLKFALMELVWATFILIICICISIIGFGFDIFGTGTCNISLHDTYWVIPITTMVLLILFIPLFFFSLFIRAIFNGFQNRVTNGLFIGTIALLIFLTTIGVRELSKFAFLGPGWTIYPPLSAILQEFPKNEGSSTFSDVLIGAQLFLILTLIVACIRTENNRMKKD